MRASQKNPIQLQQSQESLTQSQNLFNELNESYTNLVRNNKIELNQLNEFAAKINQMPDVQAVDFLDSKFRATKLNVLNKILMCVKNNATQANSNESTSKLINNLNTYLLRLYYLHKSNLLEGNKEFGPNNDPKSVYKNNDTANEIKNYLNSYSEKSGVDINSLIYQSMAFGNKFEMNIMRFLPLVEDLGGNKCAVLYRMVQDNILDKMIYDQNKILFNKEIESFNELAIDALIKDYDANNFNESFEVVLSSLDDNKKEEFIRSTLDLVAEKNSSSLDVAKNNLRQFISQYYDSNLEGEGINSLFDEGSQRLTKAVDAYEHEEPKEEVVQSKEPLSNSQAKRTETSSLNTLTSGQNEYKDSFNPSDEESSSKEASSDESKDEKSSPSVEEYKFKITYQPESLPYKFCKNVLATGVLAAVGYGILQTYRTPNPCDPDQTARENLILSATVSGVMFLGQKILPSAMTCPLSIAKSLVDTVYNSCSYVIDTILSRKNVGKAMESFVEKMTDNASLTNSGRVEAINNR